MGEKSVYRKKAHAVYLTTYHIVFVTKYRRPCINRDLSMFLKSQITKLIEGNKGLVHAIETDWDHIHILAELPIDQAVAKFIGVLKGVSAQNAGKQFADYLSAFYWGGSFWSDSYFVASTGGVTLDVIKKYVESQPDKRHKGISPHSSQTNS